MCGALNQSLPQKLRLLICTPCVIIPNVKGGLKMTLGENLKSYREQVGLSQEELGEKLSVSAETIADWETGGSHR